MNSLAPSTSEEIYELLISLLSKHPQTVEILPGDGSIWTDILHPNANAEAEPSFSPFLFVQGNLGIPQKILYKVYLHAVHVFKFARSCMLACLATTQPDHDTLDASLAQTLIASSSILSLANPAHQTALNARKRLVQLHLIDPDAELRFTALLLSSPHCAKHAEMWYHRRWLLSSTYDPKSPDTDAMGADYRCRLRFASQETFQEELGLVSRACELYPRNYFAWTHRLICTRSLLLDYLAGAGVVSFISIFRNEITVVKGWIDRHVSDYSAIHSILTLFQAAFQSGDPPLIDIIIAENLLDHAMSLVREYPTHEALWMYARTVLSLSDSWQAQQTQCFIDHFVQPLAQSSQCSKTSLKDDIVEASQCARQFLNWRLGHGFTQGWHA